MADDKKPAPAGHGAHLDFSREMSYGDYLHLDEVLAAQHRLSGHHDEMLFIIQHQTTELWMKLMLFELNAAREAIRGDRLGPALKMLSRVSRVWEQITSAWTILSTLTPAEYSQFRHKLGLASGFQSHQYRMLEFVLGNKNALMVKPHEHHPERQQALTEQLNAPSLYDEVVRLLARRGLAIDREMLERDWTQPYVHNTSVEAAWKVVYDDTAHYWDLYELGEKLVDIEDEVRQWRFRHVTTVERIIGFKRGTGGTSGVSYLKGLLEVVLFPELWRVRTLL
jgi:tryptophan 2,3-dioxygenase